ALYTAIRQKLSAGGIGLVISRSVYDDAFSRTQGRINGFFQHGIEDQIDEHGRIAAIDTGARKDFNSAWIGLVISRSVYDDAFIVAKTIVDETFGSREIIQLYFDDGITSVLIHSEQQFHAY